MERRLPAIWSCCFVSWTKDDHMGPYSFGNCLCICTSPSTTRPTPAWSLLYYKIVLKNPLLLVWCVLFFIFNCNASFQREMKPDLNAECMHSDKRRAIQHMDAKCPFTAPIQTQYPPPRGDAWHGGHCPAVNPGRGEHAFPPFILPPSPCHTVLWDILTCLHLLHGFGELEMLGCGGVAGATMKAKLSTDATSPLPAWESEVAQGLWLLGPALDLHSSRISARTKWIPWENIWKGWFKLMCLAEVCLLSSPPAPCAQSGSAEAGLVMVWVAASSPSQEPGGSRLPKKASSFQDSNFILIILSLLS